MLTEQTIKNIEDGELDLYDAYMFGYDISSSEHEYLLDLYEDIAYTFNLDVTDDFNEILDQIFIIITNGLNR